LGYEKYDFDVPVGENGDCYDRFLVRMEEMRQSIKIIKQVLADFPEGEINVGDTKSTLPEKERVLMSMEELIHHFIVATQGIEAPEERFILPLKIPKGNSASTFTRKAAESRIGSRFAPRLSSTLVSVPTSSKATWFLTSQPFSARSTS
jgi:NADH:ubiquinone oxidoreductase subunit D